MKEKVQRALLPAYEAWAAENADGAGAGAPSLVLEPPPPRVPGDFAASLPMALAKRVGRPPRKVAEELLAKVIPAGPIERVEIAGPGFLNVHVRTAWLVDELRLLLREGPAYGRRPAAGGRLLIEFVSANPNGPLHVGHGRGAALGDALARIFRRLGEDVVAEYYINDYGNQMENLGASLMWRAEELSPGFLDAAEKAELGRRPPEDLYKGEYIIDIARDFAAQGPSRPHGLPAFTRFGVQAILKRIRSDLEGFRVRHDSWFSETSLHEGGGVDAALEALRGADALREEEGALWFPSTRYGDDKDRVLKRNDGRPTYFAADAAYHHDKYRRGFARLIDIWGTDHHGYVARLKAVVQALGHDADSLTVLLYQLVTLLRGGKPVAMSTRSGEFVTLQEVVDEVGVDAARFFFALRGPNSHLEFDLDLAKKQASENPVYYVKYVHARCCALFREAEKQGRRPAAAADFPAPAALAPEERGLIVRLLAFPDLLDQCRRELSPHSLTAYLLALAGEYHRFYENHRVLAEDTGTTAFRLALVDGVRTVIADGLGLLGVSAPETM